MAGPRRCPASSTPYSRTVPARLERLMMRTNPCRVSETGGTSGRRWSRLPPPPLGSRTFAATERLVRSPVALCSRLTTCTGRSAETKSCHLPAPSPRLPSNAKSDTDSDQPSSSAFALSVRASSPGRSKRTTPAPSSPLSSSPSMRISVSTAEVLITRSELTCRVLFPGLKIGTYQRISVPAAASWVLAMKPSPRGRV